MEGLPPENDAASLKKPKQFSSTLMLAFIAMLTSFPILSTDLYLPALPSMGEQLKASVPMTNLTLVVFFIFLSFSTLFWGPLSDRYGRKPIMLTSIPLFITASIACALSRNIYQLIGFRIIQAIGSGVGLAVSMAVIKDFFKEEKREKALAMVAVLIGLFPILAPLAGAQILKFTSWRGSFVFLAASGLVVLCFSFFYKETNTSQSNLSIPQTWMRLFVILKNGSFARLVVLFSVTSVFMISFIGISSAIYIGDFGLNEETYSFFFAANALLFVLGAPLYLMLAKRFSPLTIISGCFFVFIISGVLLVTIGRDDPVLFAISVAFASMATNVIRPPSNSLMLEQQKGDSGSASSAINSCNIMAGSMGLAFISQDWGNRIVVLGLINIVIGVGGSVLWIYTKTRCQIPRHFQ